MKSTLVIIVLLRWGPSTLLRTNVPPVRAVVAVVALLVLPATANGATLQAGVGRSDVTPPTGFPTMGYVRADAVGRGQHTRLFARAIVIREGSRKLAIVTTDLGFT